MFTSASLTFYELEMGLCFFVSGKILFETQIMVVFSIIHFFVFFFVGEFLSSKHVNDVSVANKCGGTSLHAMIMKPIMFVLLFFIVYFFLKENKK